VAFLVSATPLSATTVHVDSPSVTIVNVPIQPLILTLRDATGSLRIDLDGPVVLDGIEWVTSAGTPAAPPDTLEFHNGRLAVEGNYARVTTGTLTVIRPDGTRLSATLRTIPGWISILPPAVAILFGLLLRQMVIALGLGVLVGMTILHDYQPITGFLRFLDTKLITIFTDPDNAYIMLFSLMLGGMVGIISRCGGTGGIVQLVARRAKASHQGQIATWFMGLFVFFDDYANILVVGNTMRPITDRLRISREKLAYIVDSTAAPVAGLFIISTWIGTEIGLVAAAVKDTAWADDGYGTLLRSIPYRFYSLFTLALVPLIALLRRDFGPMRHAENRARTENKLIRDGARPLADTATSGMMPPDDVPQRWYNAVVPVATVILVTVAGIYITGRNAAGDKADAMNIAELFGEGKAYPVLMWAGTTGCLVAGLMAWTQRIVSMHTIVDAWLTGMKSLMLAMVILLLAWTISSLCRDDLHTGAYLAEITRGRIPVWAVPSVTFLIAGVIAYATGTSYGTMGILIPLVVPFAVSTSAADPTIVLPTVGAVLAGATFGDHCSPISDTTILSSMACGCDHLDHVKTQMPYALVAAAAAVLLGYLPAGLGVSPWLSLAVGFVALLAVVRLLGSKPSAEA
jgi:Na+/H+ antiporter NhaC